ncbi:YopX family protein [Campylobacter lari]|uniref:YopX family protein n=2 Tax=Campylobacter lari TaxID=201 RepID=UPI0008BC3FF3|nr:YopX family protein [Campylobacter lari]EAJ0334510.1 hypothetical protein [Campylobacter lari]QKF75145.1 YopX domain-containing protein [Campylobacter lari subsp. lari]QQT72036.1 hypothetical protein I6I58_00945 [Campylobacter lari]TXE70614.1 hypothetical protein FPD43_03450 [Campylobacter lari]SES98348.1 phage uncharacterized protein TIGR01671 [Campylobacter lari subsp. lari]
MKLQDFDFRVWNKKSNFYVEKTCGNIISIASDSSLEYNARENKILAVEFSPYDSMPLINKNYTEDDYEIELFTGLYDKNGNKIYEGDILEYTRWCEQYMEDAEHSETIYEVVCFDTNGGLYSKLLNGEFGWFFEHFMNDKNNTIEEMSIIGNIHENKELLNVRL